MTKGDLSWKEFGWNALLLALCLSLGVFCLRLGINAHRQMEGERGLVALHSGTPLYPADYQRMLLVEEEAVEPLSFALWTQLDKQELEATTTKRQTKASAILLRGDSRLVLPGAGSLAQGDYEGCLIDSGTAEALFGNPNGAGGILRYNDKDYTVRGVFHAPGATIMLQAELGTDLPLPYVTLETRRDMEAFVLRHGLEPRYSFQTDAYVHLALLFSRLPVMAGILAAMAFVLRVKRSNREYIVRSILLSLLLFALATVGVLYLFELVPPSLIPSKWSDFSFWHRAGTELREGLIDFLSAPRLRPDLRLLRLSAGTLMGVPGAVFLWQAGKRLDNMI